MLPSCVQLPENIKSVLVTPVFPSPLVLASGLPQDARGHEGELFSHVPTGRVLLPPPAAPLISSFQFLASMRPRREVIRGQGRWGRPL